MDKISLFTQFCSILFNNFFLPSWINFEIIFNVEKCSKKFSIHISLLWFEIISDQCKESFTLHRISIRLIKNIGEFYELFSHIFLSIHHEFAGSPIGISSNFYFVCFRCWLIHHHPLDHLHFSSPSSKSDPSEPLGSYMDFSPSSLSTSSSRVCPPFIASSSSVIGATSLIRSIVSLSLWLLILSFEFWTIGFCVCIVGPGLTALAVVVFLFYSYILFVVKSII